MYINMFLLFWVSIYAGSTCSSGKRVVSVVVDSYESPQKFNRASSAAW